MRHTTAEQPSTSRAVLALVMAGAFMLAGCSSPPETTATTPPAPAPATTPVPTTAPPPTTPAVYQPATDQGPAQNVPVPVLPEKAKEFSKEGLIAFAEYWYSTLGYAFETGNPDPMMSISDPGCLTCNAMKKTTEAGHADGKWISGGKMVLVEPTSNFFKTPDGTYQAVTMARQEQVKYFKADKTLSKDLGITTAKGDILVGSYKDGRWSAVTVEHLAGSTGS